MKKFYVFTIFIFMIILLQVVYINIVNSDFYVEAYIDKTTNYVYSSSALRGRILDVNGNVLVDNEEKYVINYVKSSGVSMSDEIDIAYSLASILDSTPLASDDEIKSYLMLTTDCTYLLTDDEEKLISERKLSDEEVSELILSRLVVNDFLEIDKKAITIYLLMNEGYTYDKKSIASGVTYEQFARISEENFSGVLAETEFVRVYPYGDVLSSIFGSVGPIYEEDKGYYLSLGYALTDEVGISYLEKEYEDILSGEKAVYKVETDGSLTLIKEMVPGDDLYLSIDINVQLELESTLEEEMILAKSYANTNYFTDSYAAVSDPATGQIIAISAKRLIDNEKSYSFIDITNEVLTSSFTVGSIVKAASMSVGYINDLIDVTEYITDSCVKLYLVPEKCSWKSLGEINDITALIQSSNYYQYILAIRLTGNEYSYNMKLDATSEDFDAYRTVFSDFGLGSITGIDLPGETSGVTGSIVADDLLLNLAIGQYDTYTFLQILQYINTIANDFKRVELSLASSAYNVLGELTYLKENNVLSSVSIEEEYYERIIEGLEGVISSGTAWGYIASKYNPAGKTGTSETFIDTNLDGVLDTKTYSRTFIGYGSYEEKTYSIAIVTPHIGYDTGEEDPYVYNMSKKISLSITNFLFENY